MSFLAPLFLLGALAAALPVVFHLIRHTSRERTLFSSLMFLMPSPPRLTRRSRLEHLLLLLLRCAALGLLAFGFARPFIKRPVAAGPVDGAARRMVLLVDASASMRRPDLWSGALRRAEAVLGKTSVGDQVALYTFDRQATPIMTFQQWNAAPVGERANLALGRLGAVSPGWAATRLGSALIGAAELLADTEDKTAAGPAQIILISDLQEGSHLEPLQGYEWPKGVELSVETIQPRLPGNATLQLATRRDEADPTTAARARLRVGNAPDSPQAQLRVGWSPQGTTFAGAPLEVHVPPGQSRIVTAPELPERGALHRLILQGDGQEFDNVLFAVPPRTNRLEVLYFGGDSETDTRQPLYFLQRAFQETPRQVVRVLPRSPEAPVLESDAEARAAPLYVVAGTLSEPLARSLRERVAAGKTLLLALKNEAAASTLARLLELEQLAAPEARPNRYALLAGIDFRHPLFAPFADPRFSDFTKIHFWGYRRLETDAIPEARRLASFDSNDPAILEVPVGQGRIFIFTFSWHPNDSQLALSTKFVPLLYSLLEQSGAAAPLPAQYYVGDLVPLPPLAGTRPFDPPAAFTVRLPDNSVVAVPAGETNFTQTSLPGVYTVTSSSSSRSSTVGRGARADRSTNAAVSSGPAFAVNLDPGEGRTMAVALDELEKLGAPMARSVPTAQRQAERKVWLQNTELESRQKLWRWLVLAALAVLLFEIWLAGRTARRMSAPEPQSVTR